MLSSLPLKFFSRLLLVFVVTLTITGVHASSYATPCHTTEITSPSPADMPPCHACPDSPLEKHQENDGCDGCDNCECHAPLIVLPYTVAYHPLMLHLDTPDPFTYLPEIYPSRFVPPQEQA